MPLPLHLPLLALLMASVVSAAGLDAQVKALLSLKAAVTADPRGMLSTWRNGSSCCNWQGVRCVKGRVRGIALARSGLQGTLPPQLADLTSLQHLNLGGNALRGPLPARWRGLSNLERLILDNNRLSGTLPASWSSLTSLRTMSIGGNQLNGTLPVEWGTVSQLLQLNLAANNLTGVLPTPWSRLALLTQLSLGRNQLNGTLPAKWGRLRSLLQLDVSSNQLSGTLPPGWQGLAYLTSLDASSNALVGQLPASWGQLGSLQVLSLRGNQLTGSIPSSWNRLAARIYRVDLAGNAGLCGDLLDSLRRACGASQLKGTQLSQQCEWHSDADTMLEFRAGVTDPGLVLESWQAETNPCGVPLWRGVACTGSRVTGINLAGSNLTGMPLETLGSLTQLQDVQLSGNTAASGALPASWAQLTNLRLVSLGYCGLGGPLPEDWGKLRALAELSLQGNALTGQLPGAWDTMQSLRFLNLGHNALNGSLPSSWSSMISLQAAVLAANQLQGPIPGPWTDLLSLSLLDLEGNTGICGGQPQWQAGSEILTGSTNIQQSCLAVYASGTVVGIVVGVVVGCTTACVLAMSALVVYVRQQRRRLQLLQRERSVATFSPHQLNQKLAALGGVVDRNSSRSKLLMDLALDMRANSEHDYIKVAAQTPMVDRSGSPTRLGYEVYLHGSPSPVGMPSPERKHWQLAAYAQEHGVDLMPRRQRRLFRSQSEASKQSAVELV